MNNQIQHGALVAGAGAEGHGVLVGWHGRGELTRAKLLGLINDAGLPAIWAPEPRTASTQLARAVQAVSGATYSVGQVKASRTVIDPDRVAGWMLVTRTVSETPSAGSKFGDVVLVVTLRHTDVAGYVLAIDTQDGSLEQRLRDEYTSRVNAEIYMAADITKWIGEILYTHLGGVRYGGNWYIPRAHKETAQRICEVFDDNGWGTHWMRPALPVATTEQLSEGLSISLQAEVDEVMLDLKLLRETAVKAGKADIGQKAAKTVMARLRATGARIVSFGVILGNEQVEYCRLRVHDAMIEMDHLLEGGVNFDNEWKTVYKNIVAAGALYV